MTSLQGSICAKDDISQEECTVEEFRQIEMTGACIYDLAEVMLELHEIGGERHAKLIVTLPFVENFGLNRIRETQKDFPTCISFLHETRNESVQHDRFGKIIFLY